MDINIEWENFLKYDRLTATPSNAAVHSKSLNVLNVPKCGNLYISTKTKITYLNKEIDLYDVFWKLPVMQYHIENDGLIKKQMKIILYTKPELEQLEAFLAKEYYYQVFNISSSKKNIVSHTTDIYAQMNSMINTTSAEQYINTPLYKQKKGLLNAAKATATTTEEKEESTTTEEKEEIEEIEETTENEEKEQKVYTSSKGLMTQTKKKKEFKDIKKISVGMCKKDIINKKTKEKSAFYNCIVLIIRVKYQELYREVHVKMFNTGKLEIPGVKDDELLFKTLNLLIKLLKPISGNENIDYQKTDMQNVLINSNFNCGFNIEREILYDLIKNKYNIKCCFDACSYPGIQCEFHYKLNQDISYVQTGEFPQQPSIDTKIDSFEYTKVSVMIFRTGSVLMVGKCGEYIIKYIYGFLKDLLYKEFHEINQGINTNNNINTDTDTDIIEKYDMFNDTDNKKDYKKLNFVKNNYRVILNM